MTVFSSTVAGSIGLRFRLGLVTLFAPCLFKQRCFKEELRRKEGRRGGGNADILESSGGRKKEGDNRMGKTGLKIGLGLRVSCLVEVRVYWHNYMFWAPRFSERVSFLIYY